MVSATFIVTTTFYNLLASQGCSFNQSTSMHTGTSYPAACWPLAPSVCIILLLHLLPSPLIYWLFPWCPLYHEYFPVAPVKNGGTGLIPDSQALWSPAPPVLCVTCRFPGSSLEFWFRKPGLGLRICILNSQVTCTIMTVKVSQTLLFSFPSQKNPFQIPPCSDLWTLWNPFTFPSHETEMRP